MAKKTKQSFEEYYSAALGSRWPSLRRALAGETGHFAYSEGLIKPYFLDRASCIAAQALQVQDGDSVLDMCAAPGGKSLVLASCLQSTGTLTANDRSSERRNRLKSVLAEYLLPDIRQRITVTGHNAAKWGLYEQNRYDKVLLDAPCSSDRHILGSEYHLAKWSPARTKHLSIQAYAMLASAFAAVKPGGVILYSTCTVLSGENDEVIRRLTSKKKSSITVIRSTYPIGEPTEFGWQILPDREPGTGPIFFAKMIKNLQDT